MIFDRASRGLSQDPDQATARG